MPEVRLETQPLTIAPEDSASFLSLKCLADANPLPSIKWFKDLMPLNASRTNTSLSPSLIQRMTQLNDSVWVAELRFEPIKRHDAGMYSCKATNNIGESGAAYYRLDVQCSYNILLLIYILLFSIFLPSKQYRFLRKITQYIMTIFTYSYHITILYYCESPFASTLFFPTDK